MKGEFSIKIGTEVITYGDINQIPDRFDLLVAFKPDYPPSPHTQADHDLMESFQGVCEELVKRQNSRRRPRKCIERKARPLMKV